MRKICLLTPSCLWPHVFVGGGGVIQKVGPDPCSFNKNFRYLKWRNPEAYLWLVGVGFPVSLSPYPCSLCRFFGFLHFSYLNISWLVSEYDLWNYCPGFWWKNPVMNLGCLGWGPLQYRDFVSEKVSLYHSESWDFLLSKDPLLEI